MKQSPHDMWSLLGSSLWLRPVEPSDRTRVKAFLNRRDLVRSRNGNPASLLRFLGSGETAGQDRAGLVLVATDTLGAPAGFMAVHTGLGDGPAELSFAAPAEEKPLFREALRLLIDGLRANTQLASVILRVDPGALDTMLDAGGWNEQDPGVWSRRLRDPAVSHEAHRAG